MKKIIIIGGGLGGLTSAILLARKGFEVTILEKNNQVGGRLGIIKGKGFTFDQGPTLLLMPSVLKNYFSSVGRKIEDYLELEQIDPIYKVYTNDSGNSIEISSNNARTISTLEKIDPQDAKRYFDYLQKGNEYYQLAVNYFLNKNVHQFSDFLNPGALVALSKIGLSNQYYDHVSRFFRNDSIRAAFSFQSIYVGASPKDIPAAYSLIQFVEVAQGVWSIKGGLGAIASTFEKIATEERVNIVYEKKVKKIMVQNRKAQGVELEDGTILTADIVISNLDLPFTYQNLLEKETSPVQSRKLKHSCSSLMMYVGLKKKLPISHHTFLLPKDFLGGLNELFHGKSLPTDPGIYLNCASQTFSGMAPKGGSSLYVLVPVPNLESEIDWKKELKPFKEKVWKKINDWLKLNIKPSDIVFEKVITPNDWKESFSLLHGSTFGLSPTLFQSAFFRPQNRDPLIRNLYFVGASTHPGSGIPIVLYGAQNTVNRILDEQT